jgi:diguanylate cyclase (GGDEF)-like protein
MIGRAVDCAYRAAVHGLSDLWEINLPGVILLAAGGVAVLLAWRGKTLPAFPGQADFVHTVLAITWWCLAAAFENLALTPAAKLLWAEMAWPGIMATTLSWGLFIWAYCQGEDRRKSLGARWFLSSVPLAVWVLALTNPWHGLIYLAARPAGQTPGAPLVYTHGAAFFPIAACVYLGMLFSLVVVLQAAQQAPRLYRGQYLILALAMLLPWIGNIGYVTGTFMVFGFDGTPFAFLLTCGLFYRQISRRLSFVLPPIVQRTLLDALPDAVMVLDSGATVIEANSAAARLVGMPALVGSPLSALPLAGLPTTLASADSDGLTEIGLNCPDERHFVVRSLPLLYKQRRVGCVVVLTDITDRKLAEQRLHEQLEANLALQRRLHEQAMRDLLTGLHNRHFLEDVRRDLLSGAEAAGKPLTAVLLDLDKFKSLNDTWGHAAGDEVLRATARFLRAHARQDDVLVRFGGEEILILLPGSPAQQTHRRVDQWREEFAALPITARSQALHMTFSAGLASFPAEAATWDELIERADAALYQAKKEGRNRVCRWTAALGSKNASHSMGQDL